MNDLVKVKEESSNGSNTGHDEDSNIDEKGTGMVPPLSTDLLTEHNRQHGKPLQQLEWIVVRIEVTDTGYGIKQEDMAQSKLFCEYPDFVSSREQSPYTLC